MQTGCLYSGVKPSGPDPGSAGSVMGVYSLMSLSLSFPIYQMSTMDRTYLVGQWRGLNAPLYMKNLEQGLAHNPGSVNISYYYVGLNVHSLQRVFPAR